MWPSEKVIKENSIQNNSFLVRIYFGKLFGCTYNYEQILMNDFYAFQLLDTLPVCQDFNRQGCTRPTCRFVHIREGMIFLYH